MINRIDPQLETGLGNEHSDWLMDFPVFHPGYVKFINVSNTSITRYLALPSARLQPLILSPKLLGPGTQKGR